MKVKDLSNALAAHCGSKKVKGLVNPLYKRLIPKQHRLRRTVHRNRNQKRKQRKRRKQRLRGKQQRIGSFWMRSSFWWISFDKILSRMHAIGWIHSIPNE